MALTQLYSAIGGDVITAARWNNEFGNIYSNGTDVAFPVTKAVSFAGFTITLDAAGVTTVSSSSSQALSVAPGSKSGTPGVNGACFNLGAYTFTDTNTAASGTAALWNSTTFRSPTLAASNVTVTTTDAATVYIEGPPTAGSNQTITNPLALYAGGDVRIRTSDARTNTVDVPVTIISETSGAPAAGIGTGILFKAESADEVPSDVGQCEFAASDVGAGTEDTFFQVLLRVAGAALTACYRFAATGAFKAIVTHANSADRTYTLPNVDGTAVLVNAAGDTLAHPTTAFVGTGALRTATGSASIGGGGATDIGMNDYGFFPSVTTTVVGAVNSAMQAVLIADPGDQIGRFRIAAAGGGGAHNIRWRYITASDDPTIWVLYNPVTGQLDGVWTSDDPLPNGAPGLRSDTGQSLQFKSHALESFTLLTPHAERASQYIRDSHLKMKHQAYRALQLLAQDEAPAIWLREHCRIDISTHLLKVQDEMTNS